MTEIYHKDKELERIKKESDIQKTRFMEVKKEFQSQKKSFLLRIQELEIALDHEVNGSGRGSPRLKEEHLDDPYNPQRENFIEPR